MCMRVIGFGSYAWSVSALGSDLIIWISKSLLPCRNPQIKISDSKFHHIVIFQVSYWEINWGKFLCHRKTLHRIVQLCIRQNVFFLDWYIDDSDKRCPEMDGGLFLAVRVSDILQTLCTQMDGGLQTRLNGVWECEPPQASIVSDVRPCSFPERPWV